MTTTGSRPYVQVFFGLGGEDDESPGEPIVRSYRLRIEGLEYLRERGHSVGDTFPLELFYQLVRDRHVEAGFVHGENPDRLAGTALSRRLNQWRLEWLAGSIPTRRLLESIEEDIRTIQRNAFLLERALLWVTHAVDALAKSTVVDPEEFQRQKRLLFQRVREAFPQDTETTPVRTYVGPDGTNYSRS